MRTKQTLFNALVAGILSGKFKPRERLIERDLVAQFRVSRTPIREAIRRLEEFGLVHCFPNRGAIVTEFSPNDIEDLYFLRIYLERLACKLSFSNLRTEEIRTLQKINGKLKQLMKNNNLSELIEKDREFHHAIYSGSRNNFLVQVIDELRVKSYIVSYYSWADQNQIKVSIAEHKEIIKALKERNREKFQNLIEQHMVSKKVFYLENLR